MKSASLFVIGLLLPWTLWSATIQCDGSVADCQAKVNAASDGDVITFPSGVHSYNWVSEVTIPDKLITIQGRGVGVTTINDQTEAKTLFVINGPNKMPRITGFSFVGNSVGVNTYATIIVRVRSATPAKGLRIDHNSFSYNGGSHVFFLDNVYGVIDNNTFTSTNQYIIMAVYENNIGDFPGGVGFNGNVSWNRRADMGTENAVYFEDNVVDFANCASQAIDGDFGSRTVVRYNTFINSQIGMHGPGQSPARGALQNEFYGNTINITAACPAYYLEVLYFNSGTGMVFNNKASGQGDTLLHFKVDHYRDHYVVAPFMDPPFNERCDGLVHTPRIDGNVAGESGWLCADQPGTDGQLLSTPTGQIPRPAYMWGNIAKAGIQAFLPPSNTGDGYIEHVKENRDFYNFAPSFNGSLGIGAGTLAHRPATCTAGVGYWATNQSTTDLSGQVGPHPSTPISGTFYKAIAANTWAPYYTPYIYPHPLRGENDKQTIPLVPGWNWVSFNVLPSDVSLSSVLNGAVSQTEQVKSQAQSAIRSGSAWKGDLTNVDGIGQYTMYKVKVSQACSLNVIGTAITQTTPIPLHAGWNWVAYLPTTTMPIATALDSIKSQVLQVKSLTKSANHSNGAWSGTLTQLEPGQGYAIRVNAPVTLVYPAS